MGPYQRISQRLTDSPAEAVAPFQIRGANFTLLTLKLSEPTAPDFFTKLEAALAVAPSFYRNAPIVLDLSGASDQELVDLVTFCHGLRQLALYPVGFTGGSSNWERAALRAGLSVFPPGGSRPFTETETARSRPAAPPPVKRPVSRIVTDPVRSGQQIYVQQGDLIVMAPVSRGAELLAEGHIHVYAPLRGRAVAGMGGDTEARIFCHKLDAELISIAGIYQVNEQIDASFIGKSVQIRLCEEKLVFEPL